MSNRAVQRSVAKTNTNFEVTKLVEDAICI